MDHVIVQGGASVAVGVRSMDEYNVLGMFGMAVAILVVVLALVR